MRFFLYDNLNNLITVKTQAISAKLSQEFGYYDALKAEFPKNAQNIKDFRRAYYVGIPVPDSTEYELFKMERPEIKNDVVSIQAVESISDDLDVQGYIDEVHLNDVTLSEALHSVFDGSQWDFELHLEEPDTRSLMFYKISRKKALKKVIERWNIETLFRYRIKGNKIVKKVCEVYKTIGEDTGKRLIKGRNVTSFEYAKDQSELYSAAIGRGAGLPRQNDEGENTGGYTRSIEFGDVKWSKENGDPVDKPKGQLYVEIPESTAMYGWIDSKGERQPRLTVIDFPDDKDPVELLEDTYEWLKARSNPQVSVTTTVAKIGKVNLGDRMIAIDYGTSSTITVQARASKIERDLLDDDNTTVLLGNYVILSQLERDEMDRKYLDDVAKRTHDETDQNFDQQEQNFNNHIAQLQQAMKLEGQAKDEAIKRLREDLNLTTDKITEDMNSGLDNLKEVFGEQSKANQEAMNKAMNDLRSNYEETIKQVDDNFNKQVETINSTLTDIDRTMRSSTTGMIRLIKNGNNPNEITELIANNNNGSSLQFNGNGIVYRDQWGNIQSAFTADGKVAGDTLTGVTVNSMNINSANINAGTITGAYIQGNTINGGTITGSSIYGGNIYGGNIYGSLQFYDRQGGSMGITIGGSGGGGLSPEYGGEVIYVTSNNYASMVSSGQVAVSGYNGTTRMHPSYIEVNGNTVLHAGNWRSYIDVPTYSQIKGWVQDWIADYVTETGNKGHRLIIWKG